MMSRDNTLFHCLQKFVKENDATSIDHLLKWEYQKGRLFSMRNDDGLTIVHTACLDGKLKCVHVLLQHGGSAHVTSSVGWTPLHAATLGGRIGIVNYLLRECNADPLATDDMGCLATELTMDQDILGLINKYMYALTQKKDNEDQVSKKFAVVKCPLSRRRSDNNYNKCSPSKTPLARTTSLVVTQSEVQNIRNRLINTSDNSSGDVPHAASNYLGIPTEAVYSKECSYITTSRIEASYTTGTHPRDALLRYPSNPEERNNRSDPRQRFEEIRRRLSSTSISVPTNLPRAKTNSKDTHRRSKETKNRDSGVFEEEVEVESEQMLTSKRREFPLYNTTNYV